MKDKKRHKEIIDILDCYTQPLLKDGECFLYIPAKRFNELAEDLNVFIEKKIYEKK